KSLYILLVSGDTSEVNKMTISVNDINTANSLRFADNNLKIGGGLATILKLINTKKRAHQEKVYVNETLANTIGWDIDVFRYGKEMPLALLITGKEPDDEFLITREFKKVFVRSYDAPITISKGNYNLIYQKLDLNTEINLEDVNKIRTGEYTLTFGEVA
ncbi:MAG: hypothetical protein JSW73_00735, partial [Candidatus Woesearchaeota archaeon]